MDAYVTDFLTRAREKGYDVPQQAMLSALSNLQNALGYTTDVKERGNDIAYALYVLARNKKASVGDLRYFADTQLENFASPMAVAQLGAALALYGDQPRSERVFNASLQLATSQSSYDYNRSDYGSPLRDGAAMLALASETKPAPKVLPSLITLVEFQREKARYLSTQDQAWMLLAARGLQDDNGAISLDINGTAHQGRSPSVSMVQPLKRSRWSSPTRVRVRLMRSSRLLRHPLSHCLRVEKVSTSSALIIRLMASRPMSPGSIRMSAMLLF